MFHHLVLKNRSYRRFYENHEITLSTLEELAQLTRYVPSAGNLQAIKLMLINTPADRDKVFPTLGWAGMLRDWDGPSTGERPSAYIILVDDLSLGKNHLIDIGIIAQTILLGAVEKGLGGCMLANINRKKLETAFQLDSEKFSISLVIALGKPKEIVMLEDMTDNDYRYYRDTQEVHHVPKRSLEELILYKQENTKS